MNLTYSATGYNAACSSDVAAPASDKREKSRKTHRWQPYLTRSWQRKPCGRLVSRESSPVEDGYTISVSDNKPNEMSFTESAESYLLTHGLHLKKKLLERGIRNNHDLEIALRTSPFGKTGYHAEAKEKLERLLELTESYSADSKSITIARVGGRVPGTSQWDTGVYVTFTPEKWIYHGIYRIERSVPYYASDLFRFNFLKAERVSEFNIRWPETIIIEHLRESKTLRVMKSADMTTSSGMDMFLNETPMGKHLTKVFEDFGFAIVSVSCVSHLIPNCNIYLRVKPVL